MSILDGNESHFKQDSGQASRIVFLNEKRSMYIRDENAKKVTIKMVARCDIAWLKSNFDFLCVPLCIAASSAGIGLT